jgi:hypothetical protein
MTRAEVKDQAQTLLLSCMAGAFYKVTDRDMSVEEATALRAEMDRQMSRVEKLFGFVPGSWGRD